MRGESDMSMTKQEDVLLSELRAGNKPSVQGIPTLLLIKYGLELRQEEEKPKK
jgi:hypothetical protein